MTVTPWHETEAAIAIIEALTDEAAGDLIENDVHCVPMYIGKGALALEAVRSAHVMPYINSAKACQNGDAVKAMGRQPAYIIAERLGHNIGEEW